MPPNKSKHVLYCDGASRGNPGPGSYGYVLLENGNIIAQEGARLGTVTNNEAEYHGLLKGLEKSLALGASKIEVRSDSELLVRQLLGQYKVKAPNLFPLFERAEKYLAQFEEVEILHIPREENTQADELCNLALNQSP